MSFLKKAEKEGKRGKEKGRGMKMTGETRSRGIITRGRNEKKRVRKKEEADENSIGVL